MAATISTFPEIDDPQGRAIDFSSCDTPIIAIDTPVIFEDEGQEEMGDAAPHTSAISILVFGLESHLKDRLECQLYTNLNVHYHPINRAAYFSPDVMVVVPFERLPYETSSYRIGAQGPAPILAIEVLSPRTAQQGDLTLKPKIYADSKIAEYILVDTTGAYLEERLLLRRLQPDGAWLDIRDPDGGVTSALGFRITIEDDRMVRVTDARTGYRYLRPREVDGAVAMLDEQRRQAEQMAEQADREKRQADREKRQAEERIKLLEAEIARLKSALPPDKG